MIWTLVWACHGAREAQFVATPPPRPVVAEVSPLDLPVVRAGPWSKWGLSVDVPEGWTGREGDADGLMLALQRPDGLAIEVWSFDRAGGVPFPRPREGCDPLFEDQSAWRRVPGAPIDAVSTCMPDGPSGMAVFAWHAQRGDQELHIDALVPVERLFAAREDAFAVVETIRWEPDR